MIHSLHYIIMEIIRVISPSNELLTSVTENNRIEFYTDFSKSLQEFTKNVIKESLVSEFPKIVVYNFNNNNKDGRIKRQISKDRSNPKRR
jgi:hypothetical protein